MANEYPSTLLPQSNNVDDINKGILDLLKKINETLVRIDALSATITSVNSNAVHKTGNEAIAGVKTFTSRPTVPGLDCNGSIIKNDSSLSLLDISPLPGDGTSESQIRLFRPTNTTGAVRLAVYKGNNTTTANHILSGNNTSESRLCADNGNIAIGPSGAYATNATEGFLSIPSCAGVPTGAPSVLTGHCPMIVDSTNNRLYVRVGTTWKYATLT